MKAVLAHRALVLCAVVEPVDTRGADAASKRALATGVVLPKPGDPTQYVYRLPAYNAAASLHRVRLTITAGRRAKSRARGADHAYARGDHVRGAAAVPRSSRAAAPAARRGSRSTRTGPRRRSDATLPRGRRLIYP